MSPRRRGSNRTTRWVTVFSAANTITAGTAEATAAIVADTELTGATILRIVGNINWLGLTVDTAVRYNFGIITGPSTLDPADMDPDVDTGLDWMYLSSMGSRSPAYDGVDSFVEHPRDIDLRGRRKFREGENLWFVENCVGANVTSFVKLRVLLLNP